MRSYRDGLAASLNFLYFLDRTSVFFMNAVNMALLRPAVQSGTYQAANPASKAVDGLGQGGGCACTTYQLKPWWSVDLGEAMDVARVCVVNQGDIVSGQ